MKVLNKIFLIGCLCCFLVGTALSATQPFLLKVLKKEIDYNFKTLQTNEINPYYIVYRVEDIEIENFNFKDGNLTIKYKRHSRNFDVGVRVGSYEIDNTHHIRKGRSLKKTIMRFSGTIPIGDNDIGIRQSIYFATDGAYKQAVKNYKNILENLKTQAEEEDTAPDFLPQKPHQLYIPDEKIDFNAGNLVTILAECSKIFKDNVNIIENSVNLIYTYKTKYFIDTEGTEYVYPDNLITINISIFGRAKNGMSVQRYRSLYYRNMDDIANRDELIGTCKSLEKELDELIEVESGEPYSGPAIFSGKAAAVFFHEIFGHRMEGHRHRDETFGQTFTRKVGEEILSDFITIIDDPTLKEYQNEYLNGYYPVDDEGVLTSPVSIVENGILKTFLMCRKGVQKFDKSNGHGRGSIGRNPVSRMGNLLIKSKKKETMQDLRKKLIELCKEQGKEFGYLFKEVRGGFTTTQRSGPQTFKVLPILVYKIHTDGKPDTLVNGVDIVGTPLASISKILTTSSDYDIFNGMCGAESGHVPVSCIAPDILFEEIEIEKKQKSFDSDPILSPIQFGEKSSRSIEDAMNDEIKRNMTELVLDDNQPPFFIAYNKIKQDNRYIRSEYGNAIDIMDVTYSEIYADVKVGSYATNQRYFSDKAIGMIRHNKRTDINDDYYSLRKDLWRLTDEIYKNNIEKFAIKKNYLKNQPQIEISSDFSKEKGTEYIEKETTRDFNLLEWEKVVNELSKISLDYPDINQVTLNLGAINQKSIYINSENSKLIKYPQLQAFFVEYLGQRDDMENIKMVQQIWIPIDKKPDFLLEKKQEIHDNHKLFQSLLHCDNIEDYSGPILLEADSAADLLINLQLKDLFIGGTPLLNTKYGEKRSLFNKYKGRIILPSFISIYDDPTRLQFNNELLIGHYKFDREGIPAQKVEIVSNGKLINSIYSRRPDKFNSNSSGHGRQYTHSGDIFPIFSNLFIESKKTKTQNELKQLLIKKCKDNGLEYGLIIKKVTHNGRLLETYQVDVETGKETLVYGGKIENYNIKTLKDIAAVSDKQIVKEYFSFNPENCQTVILPDFLIDDIDIIYEKGDKPIRPAGLSPLKRQ